MGKFNMITVICFCLVLVSSHLTTCRADEECKREGLCEYVKRCRSGCCELQEGEIPMCFNEETQRWDCNWAVPAVNPAEAELTQHCGTNGRTYPNLKSMARASCRNNETIGIAYKGKCHNDQDPFVN